MFLACSPHLAAVILDNLLYDGQADAASALGRIAGRVGPVEPVEDQRQILGGDALTVILNLHLDEIAHVLDTDIDIALGFVDVFDRIADNIVDVA